MYLKGQEQGKDVDGAQAQAPPLARQPLPTSSCGLKTTNGTRAPFLLSSSLSFHLQYTTLALSYFINKHNCISSKKRKKKMSDHLFLWSLTETRDKVEVGSIYEIDHGKLPPRTPVQLRSIRVAMVRNSSIQQLQT